MQILINERRVDKIAKFVPFLLASTAAIAVIKDLKTGMIPNRLTIPLWIAGLAAAFYTGGWTSFWGALGAGLLTVVTTFQFTSPGGGDIKLALAVGTWMGLSGWIFYFLGAALSRVLLSLAVKLKTYGAGDFYRGLTHELKFGVVSGIQAKNFGVFQNAAQNAGYSGNLPVVSGALWVAGGVLSYCMAVWLGWGVF